MPPPRATPTCRLSFVDKRIDNPEEVIVNDTEIAGDAYTAAHTPARLPARMDKLAREATGDDDASYGVATPFTSRFSFRTVHCTLHFERCTSRFTLRNADQRAVLMTACTP